MADRFDRRGFLKSAAAAGLGVGIGARRLDAEPRGTDSYRPATDPEPGLFRAPPLETVRMGFVGVGHQGSAHVRNFLAIDGVEIRAVCDIVPEKVRRVQRQLVEAGRPEPAAYHDGPYDFRRMCEEEELDLVFTATPWDWHAPVCVAAMENGKHAATEVPMAPTLEELWQLVETAERTRRHCVMMENCCYDRTELMILNMVRSGVFGEPVHAECGYLHDLRRLKLTDFYEGDWRVRHSILRNADLYPTHGLGPVAQWLNINRGNRFDYLVSMATKSRGLRRWAAEHVGPDSPEATREYALGDVVNTLIRTVAGETILVTHDTNSPRPYSRRILLQGTNGLIRKYPDERVHVEGVSPEHRWEGVDDVIGGERTGERAGPAGARSGADGSAGSPYGAAGSARAAHAAGAAAGAATWRERWEHPLWAKLEEASRGAGHGGMDYIEDYRLIECLRGGEPMDMDVYDGAAWSCITALSERSIAERGRPVDVPDFTRGAWKERPALGIVGAEPSS